MEWRNLVLKNTLHSLRRYVGYLLAGVLAVAIFFMFTAFADNPAVQHGYMKVSAVELMQVCRVIVGIFAIFFIFYFHSALIRMRNKEFGLLMTLGVTPRQIGSMIFNESVFIGLIAIVSGGVVGIGGTKLFLMVMGAILNLSGGIPFALPSSAFIITSLFFGVVFLLEAGIIALRVRLRTPRVLILGSRAQQTPPRASRFLTILGLLCIAIAYGLALLFSTMIFYTMIPIIALTIVGTYFLFSQACVFFLARLRKQPLHGLNLLIVSRLSYRMRDYARMMTVVTVLNAMVLVGMGTVFGGMRTLESQMVQSDPVALQLASNMAHPTALTSATIQSTLQAHNLSVQKTLTTSLLLGQVQGRSQPVVMAVLSQTRYRQLKNAILQAHPELSNTYSADSDLVAGQAHFYTQFASGFADGVWFPDQRINLQVGKAKMALHIDQSATRLFDSAVGPGSLISLPDVFVVLNDQDYQTLDAQAHRSDRWTVSSYFLSNWQQSRQAVDELRTHLPKSQQELLTDTVTPVNEIDQLFSVMLFAGFFVSCLFFLAAGCSIYFKLFNQQEEDRRQFRALERVGMRSNESKQVIGREFLLLFFIPVVIGLVHSTIALLDLSNLLSFGGFTTSYASVMTAFALIGALYVLCFAIYYLIARFNYVKRVHIVMA